MWVQGSKQYKDFEDYLLPVHTWDKMKLTKQIPLEFTENVDKYLQSCFVQLDKELSAVNHLIANQQLPDVTVYGGKIQVTPLKRIVPDGVEETTRLVYELLPRIKLTDLLVEVVTWTHFSKHFVHLHTQKPPKEKSVLFAAILSDGINLGLSKMADVCPNISYAQLSWIADWYIRDENYTKALRDIVNFHHKQPFLYIGEMGLHLLLMDNSFVQAELQVH